MSQISIGHLLYAWQNQYKDNHDIVFFGHCVANLPETYSQNFQDVWALYENNFKKDGFFVEFGATDGVDGSNTLLLEKKYNWKGILAEPNPVWHIALKQNRSIQQLVFDCVYTETGNHINFVDCSAASLSTIKGYGENDEHSHIRSKERVFQVKTISLFDMLKSAPKEIDYLSIDTEGSEYVILEKYFEQVKDEHVIKCITVEHNFDNNLRSKIFDLLAKNGYERKFEWASRWDDFYILKNI